MGFGLLLSVCGLAPEGRAQTSLHVTGSATVAHSDNAFSARTEPLPEEEPPIETGFLLLDPGLSLFHESPRAQYSATYNHSFSFYREAPHRNNNQDVLALRGSFELTPVDRLTTVLQATQSALGLLVLNTQRPGANQVTVGDNDANVVELNATETWRRELSETWRTVQLGDVGLIVPTNGQQEGNSGLRLGLGLGLENTRELDAHGVFVRGTYFGGFADGAIDEDPRRYVPRLDYRWRHDFSPLFSSEATAGVAGELTGGRDPLFTAAGGATGNYLGTRFQGSLSVSRQPNVELFAGQVFLRDQVEVSGEFVLDPQGRFRVSGNASLGRNRAFRREQGLRESVKVFLGEARASWFAAPISVSLSYQYFNQFAALDDAELLGDIKRRVVQLTVTGTFPARRFEPVNVQLPTRVDGADQTPRGPAPGEVPAE